ncbi:MAG: acyl-CoA desaturase [Dactylosporangium sp.]|nr:acyl-CoA desaturase [Dactylosporangium sp.]NNJ60277.1 acyl-CoA desaturase [Dactylosporangium sp.]
MSTTASPAPPTSTADPVAASPAPITSAGPVTTARRGPKPLTVGTQGAGTLLALWAFVTIPFAALIAAVPIAWGWGVGALDLTIAVVMYTVGAAGIGTGFHRYFTHGAFKAKRWLRVLLAITGSAAIEGSLIQWVADHRRHHAYSDKEGDPHSPWRYGTSTWGLTKGLLHAHTGWLFHRELSNQERFAPDLLADPDIRRVDRAFPTIVAVSVLLPAAIGGLATWSWQGALTAFFWAGLVRIALLHHVTWSINSVCHVYGERPYATREGDRASNFWPLALLSFGENWHNSHHAEPTCARHGVDRGQIDINARIIWSLERLGWAWDVRWPDPERWAARRSQVRHNTPTATPAPAQPRGLAR